MFAEKVKQLEEKNFMLQSEVEEKASALENLKALQQQLNGDLEESRTDLANLRLEIEQKSGKKILSGNFDFR